AYYREMIGRQMPGAKSGDGGSSEKKSVTRIVEYEEDEERPIPVYHIGAKKPDGLPGWFSDLDTDKDGQVSHMEWRKGGKTDDEFEKYDRNGDGLVTAEEVLFALRVAQQPARQPGQVTVISARGDEPPRPDQTTSRKDGKKKGDRKFKGGGG